MRTKRMREKNEEEKNEKEKNDLEYPVCKRNLDIKKIFCAQQQQRQIKDGGRENRKFHRWGNTKKKETEARNGGAEKQW